MEIETFTVGLQAWRSVVYVEARHFEKNIRSYQFMILVDCALAKTMQPCYTHVGIFVSEIENIQGDAACVRALVFNLLPRYIM